MNTRQLFSPPAALVLLATFAAGFVAADDGHHTGQPVYEEVLVTGGKDAIRTLPGSASFIDEQAIAEFDVSDVNDLLGQVPGIYIRTEDGYGLRPNIGIRGATPDRSQKITLMEDTVLIAPAPYSAPAAYYFPNVNRMAAVEVFKGPVAIHYGPHTVGGAVNLVTPAIPYEPEGLLDVSLGSDAYQKYRLFYGDNKLAGNEQLGYWVDVLHYRADGFKELDTGGDTGFARSDFNTKLQWRSAEGATIAQQIDIKLGYADETSDETYLGLSDADFHDNPLRRYAASQNDKFESEHWQLHLFYQAKFSEDWRLNAKTYINRYQRSWNKFDGFIAADSPAALTVLANPDAFVTAMQLIRGEINSDGSDGETIKITDFDRSYGSHGLELALNYQLKTAALEHELETGLRFHHDYVERDHSVRGYDMINTRLVFDGAVREKAALNEDDTDAVALYISDDIRYAEWKFNLGVRYEDMQGTALDKLTNITEKNSQSIVLPGAGVFYQWSDNLGLLFGVYKGFSPANPGAADNVDPEESVNYEYGFRYQRDNFTADIIGFFSDYKNLLGRCRVSDPACTANDEFNGGKVEIGGVEITSAYAFDLDAATIMQINAVYTFTESAFQESFLSGFSEWGAVTKGDELPYMPEHQLQLKLGVQQMKWSTDLVVNYTDAMRELPGRGSMAPALSTKAYTIVNLALNYNLSEQWLLRAVAENIADKQVIVARRPFGARPNQPRFISLGTSYRF